MVTLDHSIYKVIVAEIIRWVAVLKSINWDGHQLQISTMTSQISDKHYHISDFQGWLSIKKNGIKCSEDEYIYMFDTNDVDVLCYVAINQLFMTDYGLFEIDHAGIESELEPDLVGELTAKYQFRVKQELIDKKYIKDLGMKRVIHAEH